MQVQTMFWKFSIARAEGECSLRTSKHHQWPLILKQVYMIFCLLYSQQYSADVSVLVYSSSFSLTFCLVTYFCQAFKQICVAFKAFWFFAFSFSCSTKQERRSFCFCFQLWSLRVHLFPLQLPYFTQ